MQWFFMLVTVSLIGLARAEAKVAADEPAPAVVTPAEGSTTAGQKQANTSAQKVRPSQVEVRLDALEAVERLQERQIKVPRRAPAVPAQPGDERPEQ
jgi:hypothetical protein